MHRGHRNREMIELRSPPLHQRDLRTLHPRVCGHPVVRRGAHFKRVDVQGLDVHATRRDEDHARSDVAQLRSDEVGEQKGPEELRSNGLLDALRRHLPRSAQRPGVVDQHIDV